MDSTTWYNIVMKNMLVCIKNIILDIKSKIHNRNAGITITHVQLNPDWIGDNFMIMCMNFDKPEYDRQYVANCKIILDDVYEHLDVVMNGKTKDEQSDIATSLISALEKSHKILNDNPLRYNFNDLWNDMEQKGYL